MKWRVPVLSLALAAAGGAAALSLADEKPAPKGVAAMSWLAGDWSSTEPDGSVFDETWLPVRGDAMFAVSRDVAGGATKMCELSVIEDAADGTWLRIRHFSRSLEPWKSEAAGPVSLKLTESAERRAVFEDEKRDFPRRITYSREADTLSAKLEGTRGGKEMTMDFKLKLVPRK